MIERAICEAVFREAVVACDPALRVGEALAREPLRDRNVIGLAVGKAALAMVRGAGPVTRGLVVTTRTQHLDKRSASDNLAIPSGWYVTYGGHPFPDDDSLAAGQRAIELVSSAEADDVVLALISGGASALFEATADGVSIDEYRERVREAMSRGAPIHELNALRTQLSAIKGGKLVARCAAPVVTLVVSDVIGDDPRVIGSGPTVRDGDPHVIGSGPTVRDGDRVEVVAPMASFGEEIVRALVERGLAARRIVEPIDGDVAAVADRLANERGAVVAWGEPTVRLPDVPGEGGRAQQLALELAKRLRGTDRCAFVAGSDGLDGSARIGAAGAYVDGATWDAIGDEEAARALARLDSGTVLRRVGALVITGPTGINHADIAIVG